MKRYTTAEILRAAELGEVSMIDAKHIISLLDEARKILILSGYIEHVKNQLTCNDQNSDFITYDYTEQEVDNNLPYFRKCMKKGLSPYKALLFFNDYLK